MGRQDGPAQGGWGCMREFKVVPGKIFSVLLQSQVHKTLDIHYFLGVACIRCIHPCNFILQHLYVQPIALMLQSTFMTRGICLVNNIN